MNNKMDICKTCGAEIAKSAKTCPYCGAPHRTPPTVGGILLLLLCVFLLAATYFPRDRAQKQEVPTPPQPAQVIMEQNGLRVTFLGFEKDKEPSVFPTLSLNLKFENESAISYTVWEDDISVNGMMVVEPTGFSAEVAPGKTALCSIDIYYPEESGITEPYTSAEFKLLVFNSDNRDDRFESPVITIN